MNSIATLLAADRAYVPLRLSGRPLVLKVVVVALGVAFLTASSWFKVPMYPVPMTMQTFAVLTVGAFCGWRLGLATVVAWLALAMLNLPVLAEPEDFAQIAMTGKFGLAAILVPTGGYLLAFPIMSLFVGWMAERGWTARPVSAFVTLLIAEVICFAMGVAWLSDFTGFPESLGFGLYPFILGDLLKTLLAVAVITAARRAAPTPRR